MQHLAFGWTLWNDLSTIHPRFQNVNNADENILLADNYRKAKKVAAGVWCTLKKHRLWPFYWYKFHAIDRTHLIVVESSRIYLIMCKYSCLSLFESQNAFCLQLSVLGCVFLHKIQGRSTDKKDLISVTNNKLVYTTLTRAWTIQFAGHWMCDSKEHLQWNHLSYASEESMASLPGSRSSQGYRPCLKRPPCHNPWG